ncbi:MAG: HEAT repeat domain-containing protein [Fimbriiglobus sp.]|jgi:HEAT repeat protein|nr:HEAT repeat domain-containing protein [Fimbriiglobus sp.]
MDIPAKKLVRLLQPDQPADLRAAAVLVFAELGVKDAEANAEIVARLDDPDPAVRTYALRAAGKLKITKALPVLLDRIKGGGEEARLAAESAVRLGADGVKKLQDLLHHVVPGVRKYIAAALTSDSAAGTDAGVGVLLDKDPQIAIAAANAIISRLPTMPPDRKKELVGELIAVAKDKKNKLSGTSEGPVVKLLAAINDPAAADVLWDRTAPGYSHDVRAAAMTAVGGWLTTPTKEQWKRLFASAIDRDFTVAAPALVLLTRLPASDKQLDDWVALLKAPDLAPRRLAVEKIGDRDTPEVAAGLMEQLTHPDRSLRDLARTKLAALDHGRQVLVKTVLASEAQDELWGLVKLIAPFAKGVAGKLRAEVLARACKFLEADDNRADPLFFLLREADAAGLREEVFERAVARRKKKDYETAIKYLKLLARDPSVGFDVRFELATVGVKLSGKNLAADARQSDHCLRNFSTCLGLDAAQSLELVGKAKWLDADDLFYVGFHFVEHTGQEREFGVGVLKLLIKAGGKTKAAANAKNKLKSLGVK